MPSRGHFLTNAVAICACIAMALPGAAFATPPGDATQMLKHADTIKSADHKAFLELLQELDAESASLSPYQQN